MIWKLLLLFCFRCIFLLIMPLIRTEKLLLKRKQGDPAGHEYILVLSPRVGSSSLDVFRKACVGIFTKSCCVMRTSGPPFFSY
ncbi:hypothetical protein EUGRSUZ_F01430 [Eucalyptus grandis]|uniref:Uncharacterized protein n=2 Tax=Eucalyptus grandis TaxID=71139 RepID=A0A059BPM3_EUCGR|nr:hypothetical protein EUGRSUZ_F01430 [Eucalyptus grandis]